ncbi:MAG: FHA domain-containing protein [Candidatus Obscuribacterales bacterium]|nr:FHA domain-containing protein [Candidatus Obscuribacterales bacterium]
MHAFNGELQDELAAAKVLEAEIAESQAISTDPPFFRTVTTNANTVSRTFLPPMELDEQQASTVAALQEPDGLPDATERQPAIADMAEQRESATVSISPDHAAALSKLLLEILRTTPELHAHLEKIGFDRVDGANSELASCKFGPSTRTLFNAVATFLKTRAETVATELESWNKNLPPGAPFPISTPGMNAAVAMAELRKNLAKCRIGTVEFDRAPDARTLEDLANAHNWVADARGAVREAQLRWQALNTDELVRRYNATGQLERWLSKPTMSAKELADFEAARGEWLDTVTNVRRYAENIARFHELTRQKDSSSLRAWTLSYAGGLFPDDAIKGANFPGKVIRDLKTGEVTDVELSLPSDLERTPENIAKIRRLQEWLEKNAPEVDKVVKELFEAKVSQERVLTFMDVPVDDEAKDYNFIRKRFEAREVTIGDKPLIKVVTSDQKMYAGTFSYLKQLNVSKIGPEDSTGTIKVGEYRVKETEYGRPISVGSKGSIKIEGTGIAENHCAIIAKEDGRVFIRSSKDTNTFVKGKKVGTEAIEIVDPVNEPVTIGGISLPPLSELASGVKEFDKEYSLGSKGEILGANANSNDEQGTVKVTKDGRVFLRANDQFSIFINGKKASSADFVEVTATDSITLGGVSLPLSSNFRLYSPEDWVPVFLDGAVHLVQARKLPNFANECWRWYAAGNSAVAAMDVGMIVSGGIALKVATRQAGKLIAARQLVANTAIGTGEAFLHSWKMAPIRNLHSVFGIGLGVTGLAHQSIENLGPTGHTFLEYRGYAMMLDIFASTVVTDVISASRSLAGRFVAKAGKAAETTTEVAEKLTRWENLATTLNSKTMWLCNAYFVHDIIARQAPSIIAKYYGYDSDALVDTSLRSAFAVSGSKSQLLKRLMEEVKDDFIKAAKPEDQEVLRKRLQETARIVSAKEQGVDVSNFVTERSVVYLTASGVEKTAAALSLLMLCRDGSGQLPGVLAQVRIDHSQELPVSLKGVDVVKYLRAESPLRNRHFNGPEAILGDAFLAKAERLRNAPPAQSQGDGKLWATLFAANGDRKVAAAQALQRLFEKEGRLPEEIVRIQTADGKPRTITGAEIEQCLAETRTKSTLLSLESLCKNNNDKGAISHLLESTRQCVNNSVLAKGEQEKATAAMHLQQQARILTRAIHDTTDDTAKCYLHMALILVNLDAKSGMLPARLGQGKESDTITAAGALDYLQRKITLLPPGMRLEAAGLLNQYGYSAMGGTSTRNDWNALFLTILNDKNSSVDEIRRAILGGNTPGLVHTAGSLWQESSAKLSPEAALKGNGDLTGRDKAAIEKSLRSLADHSAPEVRALSVRLLLALSNLNPVARNLELVELTSKPKSLEDLATEAKKTLETVGLDNSSGGPAGSNRAVTVRQLRNALLISQMPDAAELLPKMENRSEKLTKLLILSCNPNDAALCSEAVRNVTSRFPSLAPAQQVELVERMTDFICRASLQDSQFETAARLEVLKQLAQLVKANPDILNFQVAKTSSNPGGGIMLKTRLAGLLAPGAGRTGGGIEIRVAVAELFGACGTLDSNCRATLTESLKSDRQPKVRNAAFDALKALQDPFLLETAREVMRKETDIELLRKLQSVTERVGPTEASPAELQARFERACSRITGSALTNLNGAEEFLKVNYPLLIGTNVDKQNAQKFDAEYAGILGGLRWALSTNQNIDNQAVETKRQTKDQLRRQVVELCRRACTSNGQEELKALGWILISNGVSIREEHKKDMLELAVRGLSDACRSNDKGVRNQASQILLMCIATQPELPIDIKRHLLSTLNVLPNSSLSSGDASVALLLALRSHLHNMPQDPSDADYESARLYQSSLLHKLEQFPCAEAIPILRAISETTYQFKIERTASGAIHAINYPDQAKRSFRYDELGKLNFVCFEKGREKITWRRDGENKWLASDGRDAGANIELDSKTGRLKITFQDGRFECKDACGATISGRNQRVERVSYPDGSSRSLEYIQDKCVAYTYASSDGKTETWKLSSERNKWYRSDDKTLKNPWRGVFSFDASTGYFCCARDSVETRTPNGTYLKNTSNFGALLEHRDGPMSKWISKLDGQTDNNYSLLICPDGSYGRRFESTFTMKTNDQIDGPSYADSSPNKSERNRQQAASLLEELQSGTRWLIRRAERETCDSPPVQDKTKTARDLADGLILQLERCGTKNGPSVEQVAGSILLAGKALPIEVPDDPRRDLYRKFSAFENERVKFAAAYSLYHSALKEDQILSIEILARLRGGASLQAEIQSLLESTSCPTALSLAERDQLVSQAKVARNSVTLEPPSIEQYESSTAYALAKVDILRNAKRLLRPADDCNWWKDNGYELLHQYHFTAKSTRPSAPEKLSGLRQREEEQFRKLLEDARKTDQIGEAARIALAYIVLNNGAPLNIERKSEWSGKASDALV